MHVLFVEPTFPFNQRQFVRALHAVGARVTGIGEAPLEALDGELKGWLHGYEQVRSVVDEGALIDRRAARPAPRVGGPARGHRRGPHPAGRQGARGGDDPGDHGAHRLPVPRQAGDEGGAARGRRADGRVRPASRRRRSCACSRPRSATRSSSSRAARRAPPAPQRVDNERELESAIIAHGLDRGASVAVEEFIEGHEGFYDTLTIDGRVVHDFISHYYPGVLEAMRTRWISPQIVTTNRVDAPSYAEVRAMGQKVIEALGIGTSATHMEWFFGPKGLRFSEIGCRPPGVGVWDLYAAANDIDIYREWAMAIVHGRPGQHLSRRFAGGMINLRPTRDGRITGYEGIDEIEREFGEWIIDSHLPPPGSPTAGVEAGYMANAWIRMKHPDYDQLRHMLDTVGRTVKVLAA